MDVVIIFLGLALKCLACGKKGFPTGEWNDILCDGNENAKSMDCPHGYDTCFSFIIKTKYFENIQKGCHKLADLRKVFDINKDQVKDPAMGPDNTNRFVIGACSEDDCNTIE